jgi:drug/metabolite transporter (DMT)-like permease
MRIAAGGRGAPPRPLLYLVAAAALWGAAVSAIKFALRGFDPLLLLTIELLAATITLWAALLATGYRPPAS